MEEHSEGADVSEQKKIKRFPWHVSFLSGTPYWPVKPLWLEQMQMALTCSHKILNAHSNEAPGHNAATAVHSVQQDSPQSEAERDRFSSSLYIVFWLSGGQQPSTLTISSTWIHTHTPNKVAIRLCNTSALTKLNAVRLTWTLAHCYVMLDHQMLLHPSWLSPAVLPLVNKCVGDIFF